MVRAHAAATRDGHDRSIFLACMRSFAAQDQGEGAEGSGFRMRGIEYLCTEILAAPTPYLCTGVLEIRQHFVRMRRGISGLVSLHNPALRANEH